MGATTVSLMDGHIWIWAEKYTLVRHTRPAEVAAAHKRRAPLGKSCEAVDARLMSQRECEAPPAQPQLTRRRRRR